VVARHPTGNGGLALHSHSAKPAKNAGKPLVNPPYASLFSNAHNAGCGIDYV